MLIQPPYRNLGNFLHPISLAWSVGHQYQHAVCKVLQTQYVQSTAELKTSIIKEAIVVIEGYVQGVLRISGPKRSPERGQVD